MRSRRGFTMIELLVVMGIIALLMAILVPCLAHAREQAKSVQCQATLRELFLAQTAYADANRGRYVMPQYLGPNELWQNQLAKFLGKDPATRQRFLFCPSVEQTDFQPNDTSYGVNSCMNLPNWLGRRHVRMNASRIIVMGEKAVNAQDWLTSDDGFRLVRPDWEDMTFWVKALGHSSRSTYRHGRGRLTNVVMADGHVESLDQTLYQRDSGHWYWGDGPEMVVNVSVTCCQ